MQVKTRSLVGIGRADNATQAPAGPLAAGAPDNFVQGCPKFGAALPKTETPIGPRKEKLVFSRSGE